VGEALVVDPQLVLVAVLDHTESIAADGEREVEGALVARGIK
jgi:hypothetical protein